MFVLFFPIISLVRVLLYTNWAVSVMSAPCDHKSTDPLIIYRSEWGANTTYPRPNRIEDHIPLVIIHHTNSSSCVSTDECKSMVRNLQNYHMTAHKYVDIGYSFLVAEDGFVYEGRGWNVEGAHTEGHNVDGYGIAFIGDFQSTFPSKDALEAAQELIQYGVRNGKIRVNYCLKTHRDVNAATSCPGYALYLLMNIWPRYVGKKPCPVI